MICLAFSNPKIKHLTETFLSALALCRGVSIDSEGTFSSAKVQRGFWRCQSCAMWRDFLCIYLRYCGRECAKCIAKQCTNNVEDVWLLLNIIYIEQEKKVSSCFRHVSPTFLAKRVTCEAKVFPFLVTKFALDLIQIALASWTTVLWLLNIYHANYYEAPPIATVVSQCLLQIMTCKTPILILLYGFKI